MEIYNYFLLILFFLIYFTYSNFTKRNIFENSTNFTHQNLASDKRPPLIGGYFLIICLILNQELELIQKIFLFLIFLFGTLSDYQKLNSPKIRIFGQVLFILIFVKISNVNLYDTRIDFLDNLLSFEYFNILFVTFCVLILINGSNFIDGLNGLVSGYYIIVLLILYYLNLETAYVSNQFIIFFVSVLVVIFILNLFNKIYMGDSGSYLLGFFVGIYMINIYVDNNNISPFFIILLLWYPCFENLFSIIRKIQLKSSPLNPDNKHTHQLVFVYFKNKLKLKKIIINNISSMLIIFYNLIIISVGAMNIYNTKFQILLILTNVFTYLILYKILHFTKKFKNSKS